MKSFAYRQGGPPYLEQFEAEFAGAQHQTTSAHGGESSK